MPAEGMAKYMCEISCLMSDALWSCLAWPRGKAYSFSSFHQQAGDAMAGAAKGHLSLLEVFSFNQDSHWKSPAKLGSNDPMQA